MIPYPLKIEEETKDFEIWLIFSNNNKWRNYYIKANSAQEAIQKFEDNHFDLFDGFNKDGVRESRIKKVPYTVLKVEYLGHLIE